MQRKPRAYVTNAPGGGYWVLLQDGLPFDVVAHMGHATRSHFRSYTAARLIARAVNAYAAIVRKRVVPRKRRRT